VSVCLNCARFLSVRFPACAAELLLQIYLESADLVVLLCYSLALNFDEYARGWETIGTSLPSDAKDCRDR
jgi:hypothetical protein